MGDLGAAPGRRAAEEQEQVTADPLLRVERHGRWPGTQHRQWLCRPSPGPSVLGTDCGFTRSSNAFLAAGELSHEATSAHSSSQHHAQSPSPRRPHSSAPSGSPPQDPAPAQPLPQIPGPGARHGSPPSLSALRLLSAPSDSSHSSAPTAVYAPAASVPSLAQASPKLGCVCLRRVRPSRPHHATAQATLST